MLPTCFFWICLLQTINYILADENPYNNADINSVITYTPSKGWINDPNGLIYVDGLYHLFYQYNPTSNQPAGRICWGHAVSKDLVDWQDKNVAIPYNERDKEQIFSGNAVIDETNSSGLGLTYNPVVAFMTSNFDDNAVLSNGWSAARGTQVQSMAYSLDRGHTWIRYSGNPIIRQPPNNYSDQFWSFRDPNVFWYQPHSKWVMTLVLSNKGKAVWYSSQNLIDWTYTGEFGWEHSPEGEWECPALAEFMVRDTNERKWVLIMSTNPGGLAGVSGMYYHVGHFDGFTFHKDDPLKSTIDWLDYGADCYAGVFWGNVPDNRMIISVWNNNWGYGVKMGDSYKGGISSRELILEKVDREYKLLQKPIWQLNNYVRKEFKVSKHELEKGILMFRNQAYKIGLVIKHANESDFSFVIEDINNDVIAKLNYIHTQNVFCIERISPDSDKTAGKRENHCADVIADDKFIMDILMDNYIMTAFLNGGKYTFTELLLPYFEIRKLRLLKGYSEIKAEAVQAILSKT